MSEKGKAKRAKNAGRRPFKRKSTSQKSRVPLVKVDHDFCHWAICFVNCVHLGQKLLWFWLRCMQTKKQRNLERPHGAAVEEAKVLGRHASDMED